MAVTILEALENAKMNLETMERMKSFAFFPLVNSQLTNAISLLEKGYSIDDEVETIIDEYGSLEEVPYKN